MPEKNKDRRLRILGKRKERWNKALARRKPEPGMPASKGYKKAAEEIQSLSTKIVNVRRDSR